MAYQFKKELEKPERFVGGHRLCAGCGAGITCRAVMRALEPEDRAVITNATGCLEVSSFMYPYTSWTESYVHSAFENAAATCSGVEACYKALKKQGKVQFTRFRLVRRRAGGVRFARLCRKAKHRLFATISLPQALLPPDSCVLHVLRQKHWHSKNNQRFANLKVGWLR